MSRAAVFNLVASNTELNAIGINDDTVFHNWSSESKPTEEGPFIIFRWGSTERPVFGDVKAPEQLTIWVHYPSDLTNDYTKILRIFDIIDGIFKESQDVIGGDGYTLSFVTIGGRSGDFYDDGFKTISKNGSYEVFSRKSA